MIRSPIVSLILCCLLSFDTRAESSGQELVLAVIYAEGQPFYAFDDNTHQSSGLFSDIAQQLALSLDIKVHFLPTARNKIENDIIEHKADAGFLAPKWLNTPEALVFSEPVFTYQHAFYAISAPNKNLALVSRVKGKSVCLRENYNYPELDAWLQDGSLTPVRVSRHSSLFDMLQLARCDLIYTNTFRARWTLRNHDFVKAVYQVGTMGNIDEIPLAFSLAWSDKMPQVNAAIAALRESGILQRIIEKNMALKDVSE